MKKRYNTDWLASKPVFYNQKTLKVSHNINDVIDWGNLQLDPEGLNNYLDFGYSVFGQTPVKNVKFLLPNQELIIHKRLISIKNLKDPVEKYIGKHLGEEEVIDLIRRKVQNWERKTEGEIVIPTSGGYDSRLLNTLIDDKTRIRSFSFGVSDSQRESFEVIYPHKLSKILKTRWEQITLGNYHKYFEDWNKLYGISTHAHGMYQIEFYKKILHEIGRPTNLLSGIIGDGWSGNVTIKTIDKMNDVELLGYSHNMNSDSRYSRLKTKRRLLKKYFDQNRVKLDDERWRIIESMRMKMTLLSYLVELPTSLGFNVYAPFLDVEIAVAMLNLAPARRRGRLWQRDYFKKLGLDFERQNLKADKRNTLNMQLIARSSPKPLSTKLFSEIISRRYLEDINRRLLQAPRKFKWARPIQKCLDYCKIGWFLRRVGLPSFYGDGCPEAKAYYAYLTLKPLEYLLKKYNETK